MAQERQEAMAQRVDAGPFVRRFRTEILAEWKLALQRLPAARQLRGDALVDHVPVLLDQIADLAEAIGHDRPLDEPLAVARQHVNDRLANGFDIAAMVEELSMLRGC